MEALSIIKLTRLMELTSGRPEIVIALIDGPVARGHPDLADVRLTELPRAGGGSCTDPNSEACQHGTFIAGILCASRRSVAPAICPSCTLLLRPIFAESVEGDAETPTADPEELAQAIWDSMRAGAHVINLSAAISQPWSRTETLLTQVLDEAARRGVILVAAAGNQGTLGSTTLTRHPWVMPVAAYDLSGRPIFYSNLGHSIGLRGVGAPGDRITSLGVKGRPVTMGGTSAAVPFVTGAIALLWSQFPNVTAGELRYALMQSARPRKTVVPPLLDTEAAYASLITIAKGRRST